MRRCAVVVLSVLCAACGAAPAPVPAPTSSMQQVVTVNPARIDRARSALPDGYEVSPYRADPAPLAVWGFRGPVTADPAVCLAVAAPAVDAATARGWSASGPGGIVYAVVAAQPVAAPAPAPDTCARWTATAGRTSGTLVDLAGPAIETVPTRGMRGDVTTVVEGGNETRSHVETFVAELPGYLCFVTVVTDPGLPHPALDTAFASGLLTTVVSALRG